MSDDDTPTWFVSVSCTLPPFPQPNHAEQQLSRAVRNRKGISGIAETYVWTDATHIGVSGNVRCADPAAVIRQFMFGLARILEDAGGEGVTHRRALVSLPNPKVEAWRPRVW